MESFKILQVSIDFSTNFLIISIDSGGSDPEPHTNAYLLWPEATGVGVWT